MEAEPKHSESEAELIASFVEKRIHGMDMSAIRAELRELGLNPEEIRSIVYSIDEQSTGIMQSEPFLVGFNSYLFLAWTLIVGGILVTVGTYMGWFGNRNYYIVMYGPIISGLSMLGYSNRRRTNRQNRKGGIRR